MPEVIRSETFRSWLAGLRDRRARIKIDRRIERLEEGNPGDHKSVGGGLLELRIDFGPGYRVYYKAYGAILVVVFAGGEKDTQDADISKARALLSDMEKEHGGDLRALRRG